MEIATTQEALSFTNNNKAITPKLIKDIIEGVPLATKSYVNQVVAGQSIDLSGYAKTSDIPTKLSQLTNDSSYITSSTLASYATTLYVNTQIANLINSAPETLDTLGEIAALLESNSTTIDLLNSAIANKADKSSLALVATTGKYSDLTGVPTDLSTFTDTGNKYVTASSLVTTLAGYPTLAVFNSHKNDTVAHTTTVEKNYWNSKADGSAFDNHVTNEDRHVTAADKTNWNNKIDAQALETYVDVEVTAKVDASETRILGEVSSAYTTKTEFLELDVTGQVNQVLEDYQLDGRNLALGTYKAKSGILQVFTYLINEEVIKRNKNRYILLSFQAKTDGICKPDFYFRSGGIIGTAESLGVFFTADYALYKTKIFIPDNIDTFSAIEIGIRCNQSAEPTNSGTTYLK